MLIIFSGIAAAGVLLTAFLSIANRNKILEVHAMVNSRLTAALDKIIELERIIKNRESGGGDL